MIGGLGLGEMPVEDSKQCSSPEVRTGGSYTLTVNGNTVAEFNVNSKLTKQGDVGSFGFGW